MGRRHLHDVYPGKGILAAEVGLPLSATAKFLVEAEKYSKRANLTTILFGHLGDGIFHGWTLYELGNSESYQKAAKLIKKLVRLALSLDGTTSGEHGIGIGKREFLEIEHDSSLKYMKSIKKMLDPKNILNPGKIFLD